MNEKLSKLKSLYAELDKFQASGEDVVADIRAEINNLELQYLKEDVLPRVSKQLGSCLAELRCSIDFSIQFDGEKTLDYSFCTSGSTMLIRDKAECISDTDIPIVLEEPPSLFGTESEHPTEPPVSNVRIVDYSEKAVAVYGDTKQLAETFRSMGGYFNARLREGMGWVFSKRRRAELESILEPYLVSKHGISRKAVTSSPVGASEPQQTNQESTYNNNAWIDMVISMRCMPNKGFIAPHKVVFILAVIDCIKKGYIRENHIFPTITLTDAFKRLWKQYVPSNWPFKENPYQPFIHLSSEPFYHIVKHNEKSNFNINENWNRSNTLKYVKYGKFDNQLFNLLLNNTFSSKLTEALISKFLSPTTSLVEPVEVKHITSTKKLISDTSTPVRITGSKETGMNVVDFKLYLNTVVNKHGRKYSQSSISVYATSLTSAYMVGKIRNYESSGNIFAISNPSVLSQLYANIQDDRDSKLTSSSYLIALKLYIQFFFEVRKGTFSLNNPKQTVTREEVRPISEARLVAKKFALNDKLTRIITDDFTISKGSATDMLVQYIENIGPELVYEMKILYLGRPLVDIERHPKYKSQCKSLVGGYFVNTCSSTPKKIEQMQEIANQLGIKVSFEASR
ncbi:MAG: hypothetical protein K2N05_09225 [Muribaculaceae bacterium]|nr:hypothetical protein [Muribaculaceae bacterium]